MSKKQDKQDMKQEQKQGQESRAYWKAGQAGRLARVYRRYFTHLNASHPHTRCNSRAYIGVFYVLLVLLPICLLGFMSCFWPCFMSCLSCFPITTGFAND